MKFKDIDDATAEMIAKVASELYAHDYPVSSGSQHIKASHVKYVYRAAEIVRKAIKEVNK